MLTKEDLESIKVNPELFLYKGRQLTGQINRLYRKHDRLQEQYLSVTQELSFAPTFSSYPQSMIESIACELDIIRAEISVAAALREQIRWDIAEVIRWSDDIRERHIGAALYIQELAITEVAANMGISRVWAWKIKKSLLKKIKDYVR